MEIKGYVENTKISNRHVSLYVSLISSSTKWMNGFKKYKMKVEEDSLKRDGDVQTSVRRVPNGKHLGLRTQSRSQDKGAHLLK